MNYTKEEILNKIEQAFYKCCEKNDNKEILLIQLINETFKNPEDKDEILLMFKVKKYTGVITQHKKFEVYTNTKNQQMVREKKKNVIPSSTSEFPTSSGIYPRIKSLLDLLNQGLYEKQKVTRLMLLSVIAGESIFLLGPPGTAKSMIARRLTKIFKNMEAAPINYFEYLLNEFTTPDELFGPVSIKALNNDEYIRMTKNFLPSADVAFLDEVWKAGPAILNTLLTIINEKKFHNGNKIDTVPLKALIAASNELPAKQKGLEALWDRFIVRIPIEPISLKNSKDFFNMAMQAPDIEETFLIDEASNENLLSFEELRQYETEIAKVDIPEIMKNVIIDIRQQLAELNKKDGRPENEKYYISDRRWKHILNLIRTSAYLHGRTEVNLMDLSLITDCIWSTEMQKDEALRVVGKAIEEYGIPAVTAISDIEVKIENFKDAVNNQFFDEVDKIAVEAKPLLVEHNSKKFYKTKDSNGKIYYFEITDDPIISYMNMCDENFDSARKVHIEEFSQDKKTIKSKGEIFTIEWKEAEKAGKEFIAKSAIFNDAAIYTKFKQELDKNHYNQIATFIGQEQEKLRLYQQKSEKEFSSHLFGERQIASMIRATIENILKTMDDLRLKLDKEKSRYTKKD